MKHIRFSILMLTFFLGCAQDSADEDNAIVTGHIYKKATPSDSVLDSIVVDTLSGGVDTFWTYIDWDFSVPVESVKVYVESDENSEVPYQGSDIIGYTDAHGVFSIPVYLGNTPKCERITGYEPVYYADVRVLAVYKMNGYDFGGGITLGRGKTFPLWDIALVWFNPQEAD